MAERAHCWARSNGVAVHRPRSSMTTSLIHVQVPVEMAEMTLGKASAVQRA